MIAKFFLSIVVAFVFGYLLVGWSWPSRSHPALLLPLLALPAGLALTSASYFLWMVVTDGQNRWYPLAEGIFLVSTLTVVWIRHRKKLRPSSPRSIRHLQVSSTAVLMSLAFLVTAALCFRITFKLAGLNPWGYWDAWAHYNVKARYLFAGGEHWTWIFQGARIAHHDYPLLLECSVARIWTWNSDIALTSPQILSVIWGVWSLFILYGVVAWLRSSVTAAIISLAYLTYMPLLFWSAMQYADLPLACYMMLANAMIIAAGQFPDHFRHFTFLGGFFAGSAAWCKNEGIVFAVLIILWWGLLGVRHRLFGPKQGALALVAGLCIIGSATVLLKLVFAAKSDLAGGDAVFYELLRDSGRHRMILEFFLAFARSHWSIWPLLLLIFAFVLHQYPFRQVAHVGALICALSMVAIYYVAFAISPHDLEWHLRTAVDRLLLQTWPLFLLSFAVLFANKLDTKCFPNPSKENTHHK